MVCQCACVALAVNYINKMVASRRVQSRRDTVINYRLEPFISISTSRAFAAFGRPKCLCRTHRLALCWTVGFTGIVLGL